MKKGIKIKDRTYHFINYERCFIGILYFFLSSLFSHRKGSEAFQWLINSGKFTEEHKAINFMNSLMEKHFFHHVAFDHHFKNEYLFYR